MPADQTRLGDAKGHMVENTFKYKAFISYSHAADGLLAPAIQKALQRLAKPWYKMRAIEVFRDETNLSVSPNLWDSVAGELARSEFFILLASRKAASSYWVRREVEFWLANRSSETLLIVLTDGIIAWDMEARDFDWNKTNALPRELAGHFDGEPLFLDFREARSAEDLSLDNPVFKNKVVFVAAALRGISVADLIGEEVRQFKRTKRVRNGAISALTLLLALVALLAVLAYNQSEQRLQQFKLAQASSLANQARRILPENPTIALRLSLEAFRLNPGRPPNVVQNALCQAFYEPILRREALYSQTHQLGSYVRFASVSPDGTHFFTSSNDFVVRRFDWEGRRVFELPHEDIVRTIAHSQDGRHLLTVTLGSVVRVWDATRGKLVFRLDLSRVSAATFAPDGAHVLIAHGDTVELRDASGRVVRSYSYADGSVATAFFAAGEARILTSALETQAGGSDKTYTLRDMGGRALATWTERSGSVGSRIISPTRGLILTLFPESDTAYSATVVDLSGTARAVLKDFSLVQESGIQFSPSGERIVGLTEDFKAKVWDTQGTLLYELTGHTDVIEDAHFLPDGSILTASADNTAVLWDTAGHPVWTLKAHDGNVTSAVFSSLHRRIATTSTDGTVRLWDLDEQYSLVTLEGLNGYALAGAVSPSNRFYLTADDARVDLWNAAGRRLHTISGHSGYAKIGFSPREDRFVTAPFGNHAKLWSLRGGEIATLQGHTGEIISIRFSPDGERIVTASADSTARLWSADGRPLARFSGHRGIVSRAVFSPDGQRVLTGSTDSSAVLWKLDGSPIVRFVGHRGGIASVTFSRDGTLVLTASSDSTARLWNGTGGLLARLQGHQGAVNKAAFVGDGQSILTVSADYTARLWDRSGTRIAQVHGQDAQLSDAYASNRGDVIIASSYAGDGNVLRLSDTADNEICTLRAHSKEVYSVVFSPDDQRVISLGYDGRGIVWFLPPTIFSFLSSRRLYELSDEERQRYGVIVGGSPAGGRQ